MAALSIKGDATLESTLDATFYFALFQKITIACLVALFRYVASG